MMGKELDAITRALDPLYTVVDTVKGLHLQQVLVAAQIYADQLGHEVRVKFNDWWYSALPGHLSPARMAEETK